MFYREIIINVAITAGVIFGILFCLLIIFGFFCMICIEFDLKFPLFKSSDNDTNNLEDDKDD